MAEPAYIQAKPASTNVAEFSVSELSGAIKRALEDGFGFVRVRGEISGYRGPHASGHCYFGLKDDRSKIEAVIWKGAFQRLRFKPQEGLEVIAQGKITTYPGSSKYQIVIETLEPAGVGALMALLEERKRKFAAEGLFDDDRKRPLPYLPRVVGIVTSPTGAVIRDMLHGFMERCPTRVIVWPVRVQGEGSAEEVAAAIRGFNRLEANGRIPRPDVLIVARGGGSLEDLWGFNEEVVVRAAAASDIPLISAVGHETDWTLLDLAADARAPTPTKAAEWAVPMHADLVSDVASLRSRLLTALSRGLQGARSELKAAARGLPRPQDLVALPRQRFDRAEQRLGQALRDNTHAHARRLLVSRARLTPALIERRLERSGDRLRQTSQRALQALSRYAGLRRNGLDRTGGRLRADLVLARVARADDRLEAYAQRAVRALRTSVERRRAGLHAQAQMLNSLSYQSALNRGFALLRDREGRMIRQVEAVMPNDRLEIELADGRIDALAGAVRRARTPRTAAAAKAAAEPADAIETPEPPSGLAPAEQVRPRIKAAGGGGQGSLF